MNPGILHWIKNKLVIKERNILDLIVETTAWKQMIQQFENDNIYFKTRLASVLSVGRHDLPLEQFEHFQNRFLKMDGQITLLKHEVRQQLEQLQLTANVQDNVEDLSLLLQSQLGKRIDLLEQQFELLLHDFSSYIDTHFPEL